MINSLTCFSIAGEVSEKQYKRNVSDVNVVDKAVSEVMGN